MKNFQATFFILAILMQPATAFAVDYSNFDSFCQAQLQNELELIKKDTEEGLLSEAEAEEEVEYLPKIEQCVCFYGKILKGTNTEFTLYMQKRHELELTSYEKHVYEDIEKLEIPKYPDGLNIVAFVTDTEKACGIDSE